MDHERAQPPVAPYGTYANERPKQTSADSSTRILLDWIVDARNALVAVHNSEAAPIDRQKIKGLISSCPFIPVRGPWPSLNKD